MPGTTRRLLPIVTAMVVSFGLAACAGEPQEDGDGAGELSLAQQTDEATSGESAERTGAEARDERREESGGEHDQAGDRERGEEGDGEHGEEEHGEEGEEGEESGEMIARTASWDATRNGARLMLSFNASSNAFVGRVENTTNEPLCAVRVEVHLDTGVELGPTERTDIPYTRSIAVSLPAGGQEFSTWTAHPEISRCENQ